MQLTHLLHGRNRNSTTLVSSAMTNIVANTFCRVLIRRYIPGFLIPYFVHPGWHTIPWVGSGTGIIGDGIRQNRRILVVGTK